MNNLNLTKNKKYILVAVILFIILIPLSVVIIMTLLGGNPTNTNTENTTTNITANNASLENNETNQAGSKQISPTSSTLQLPLTFHNIFPGKATTETVLTTVGNPIQIASQGAYIVYYYKTPGTYRYNVIIFQNNIVQYIIEQKPAFPPLFTQYKTQIHKHEDGILYDVNNDDSVVNLYTFAQNGIAFANDQVANQTSQVHYFIPESYQTFLLSEGVYLSLQVAPTN